MIKRPLKIKETRVTLVLLFLCFALILCLSSVSAAGNDTIYVDGFYGNDSNSGHNWTDAKLTIKNAIGTININGTVYIAGGIYSGENNTNITIDKNMTIIGQSQNCTIINGTNSVRIFNICNNPTVTLKNLTLTSGNAPNGAALYNDVGALSIENCIFSNNNANWYFGGGAIYNTGTLSVTGSIFTDNAAVNHVGGAIYNSGTLSVNDSIFTGNTASSGGAIGNFDGTLTVTSSTFTDNAAVNRVGGAIYNSGTLSVNDSIFTGNTATNTCGGAIDNYFGTLAVTCSNFTGNTATMGGAINNYGTLTVTGSIFTSNTATNGDAGAIGNFDGTLAVMGCTFTDNTATNGCGGAIGNVGNFCSCPHLSISGNTLTDNTAKFGGAIYNYYGTANVHFNRITGNTATQGDAIYAQQTMNATDNWWGSNSPDFNSLICATGKVDVFHTPWLYLTLSPNPYIIPLGSTSTLTASFNQVTDGTTVTPIDPVNGHIPDGSPVTFTTTLGNVGSKSVVKYTLYGFTTAILRGDEAAGNALIGLITDSQILSSTVTITPGVNAASTTITTEHNKTVGMQTTGAPLAPLAIAVLSVLTGLVATWKKQ